MGMKKLVMGAAVVTAGLGAYQKRNILDAVLKLEKSQGDLFTRVKDTGSKIVYLSKNDNQSDELFRDWIAYNGWKSADSVGEGFFYINEDEETLTVQREAVAGGRYIAWTASAPIEK